MRGFSEKDSGSTIGWPGQPAEPARPAVQPQARAFRAGAAARGDPARQRAGRWWPVHRAGAEAVVVEAARGSRTGRSVAPREAAAGEPRGRRQPRQAEAARARQGSEPLSCASVAAGVRVREVRSAAARRRPHHPRLRPRVRYPAAAARGRWRRCRFAPAQRAWPAGAQAKQRDGSEVSQPALGLVCPRGVHGRGFRRQPARPQVSEAQKRWMRRPASSSFSLEVA